MTKDGYLLYAPAIKNFSNSLKAVSRKKAAPWIFAHYQKLYNFYPILMKLGGNDHLMG